MRIEVFHNAGTQANLGLIINIVGKTIILSDEKNSVADTSWQYIVVTELF